METFSANRIQDSRHSQPRTDLLKTETRRLEALGILSFQSQGEIMIKGQVFKMRTLGDLVLMIVRLRYEKGLNNKVCARITRAGQAYELLDADGRPTAKYFALMNDDAEKLARELTGQTKQAAGLCTCGCGRMVRGRQKTATEACRKRLSRMAA